MPELKLAVGTVPRIFFVDSFSSKKRAIEALASIFSEQSELTISDILESFMNRERLGSTAIGNGVAIPHGRLKNFPRAMGALIIVKDGVDFDAKDNAPVEILFGLLIPDECCDQHLSLLQGIASIASLPDAIKMLTTEKSSDKLFEWIMTNNQLLGEVLQ